MSEHYTEGELERGADAITDAGIECYGTVSAASAVLAAVLPEHDKRVRAQAYEQGRMDEGEACAKKNRAEALREAAAYARAKGDKTVEWHSIGKWLDHIAQNPEWLRAHADDLVNRPIGSDGGRK